MKLEGRASSGLLTESHESSSEILQPSGYFAPDDEDKVSMSPGLLL